MSELIKLGDTVVIRLHDEKSCYITKVEGTQKIYNRTRVNMKNMIGRPYGSIFEIINHQIKYIPGDNASIIDDFINYDNGSSSSSSGQAGEKEKERGDNSGYGDTNTAQKLSFEDIKLMRESGASGTEIIQNLISNSETWAIKTSFAQEKWMKKKQQKYSKRLRVLKATPASICEVYNNKNQERICGMRGDLLAQLIYQSGVRAGGNLLLFESMIGLVVATAAYKMRGVGRIYAVYEGQQPHFELVNSLNLTTEDTDIIQPVPAIELASAVDDVLSHGFLPHCTRSAPTLRMRHDGSGTRTLAKNHSGTNNISRSSSRSSSSSSSSSSSGIVVDDTDLPSKRLRVEPSDIDDNVVPRKPDSEAGAVIPTNTVTDTSVANDQGPIRRHNTSGRQVPVLEHTRRILRSGFNSLIIASKYHPLPILKECLPLLGPNSSFAVYCEYMEPLTECYLYAQHRGDCLRLRLCDTWLREYQTLPGRVHPQMYMPVSGGYLLIGVYVGMAGIPKASAESSSDS